MSKISTSAAAVSSPTAHLDCGQLLQAVAYQEEAHQQNTDVASQFGHPEPPNLSLFPFHEESEDADSSAVSFLFAVAYTAHFVYAQCLHQTRFLKSNDESIRTGPVELCCMFADDEEIKALTVVPLDDEHLLYLRDGENAQEAIIRQQAPVFDVTVDAPSQNLASKGMILQGVMSVSNSTDTGTTKRISVIVGTNKSRVYTVEIIIDVETGCIMAQRREEENDELYHHNSHQTPMAFQMCEVFPHDDDNSADHILRKGRKFGQRLYPFQPTGGVVSLSPFRIENAVYVWILYRDGTLVRIHSTGLFPSIWKKGAELNMSVEDIVSKAETYAYSLSSTSMPRVLVRCRLHFPGTVALDDDYEYSDKLIVPLPRSYPSPIANLFDDIFLWKEMNDSDSEGEFGKDDDQESTKAEGAFGDSPEPESKNIYEALVFSASPTLTFYTSEIQFVSDKADRDTESMSSSENAVLDVVMDGTKALMGSVLGSAMGALRWTVLRSAVKEQHNFDDDALEKVQDDTIPDVAIDTSPFPSLWRHSIDLVPGQELHDAPRHVEFCCIEPGGTLAAAADGLGRVILIDLFTKQVIRIWKGFRDARCYWIQQKSSAGFNDATAKSSLHLAIHSRQRRVLEVWPVRSGPRVTSVQLNSGAELIPVQVGSSPFQPAMCYLLHSKSPGTTFNYLEEVIVKEAVIVEPENKIASTTTSSVPILPPTSSREAALRLQHLRQMLATDAAKFTAQEVYQALREIRSLTDLAISLDLLAESEILEKKLGVKGSSFQKMAVAYCNEVLDTALNSGKSGARTNPNVIALRRKLLYHTQVIDAFDSVNKFQESSSKDEGQRVKNPSNWIIESFGWASVHGKINRVDHERGLSSSKRAVFHEFASGCVFPEGKIDAQSRLSIYFSDSSRTRRDIIVHVYKPLLADIFSFNVVYSIFEALGIRKDSNYMLQCFGEWIMTLPLKDIYQKGLLSVRSPMIRFLQDLATVQIDEGKLTDDDIVLGTLHSFCEQSVDLVRSFMLAVLCFEAAEKASLRKEKMTYGKVRSSRVTKRWAELLRKLRVCLLVSLRLNKVRLAAPITIRNVEEEGLFSVYEWLAYDELSMSHKYEEIVSLEHACRGSSFSFDPSTIEGDGPSRFKLIQNSCLSAGANDSERSQDDKDKFGALLLFLPRHNEARLLAANRATLLASFFSSNPSNLEPFRNALKTIFVMKMDSTIEPLTMAISLHIWQTSICPIYRALLFGFDDVHEMNEHIIEPLLQNDRWLAEFGQLALKLIDAVRESTWTEDGANIFKKMFSSSSKRPTWPPVRIDTGLLRMIERLRQVDTSAINAHRVILSALLVSRDIDKLVKFVPGIHNCFQSFSLYDPMTLPSDVESLKSEFLEDAIIARAISYDGPTVHTFAMDEIETLATIWGVDLKTIRSFFLLAMFEAGKDALVDELLTGRLMLIDVRHFVTKGVDIACQRLDQFLNSKEMKTSDMRDTMGLLDADLCEWIHQRSKNAKPMVDTSNLHIPIGQTHQFTLRLLGLSASSNEDTTLRVKIHSLVVLSGTLVKVLELRRRLNHS